MILHDALAQREPEARCTGLRREEDLEHTGKYVSGDWWPGVMQAAPPSTVSEDGRHQPEVACFWCGVDRVDEQVAERLGELLSVDGDACGRVCTRAA